MRGGEQKGVKWRGKRRGRRVEDRGWEENGGEKSGGEESEENTGEGLIKKSRRGEVRARVGREGLGRERECRIAVRDVSS